MRDTQFSEILRLQEEKEKAEERVEELELKLQRLLKRSENSVRRSAVRCHNAGCDCSSWLCV